MFSLIKKCDSAIEKFSSWLLVISILSLLFFSSLSIIIRWFHHNITWIDPFSRHLVFFSAFLGGVIATGRGTHIAIDVVGRLIESRGWHKLKDFISKFVLLVSLAVLMWMIKSGIDFTKVEMEFSKEEFWGIQSGYLVMLIPIGLVFIALRFLFVFLLSFETKRGEVA
jgi:TRAP-type C4-dicarboxylate transport system permease small subunit